MRWSDGSVIWVEDCHGDSYSVVPFNDALYVATHAHFCGNIGGFGESNPEVAHRAIAFTQAATRTVAHNTLTTSYYYDFGGQPGPTLLDWSPTFQTGTYTGAGQAAWSVAAGGSYVVFGGEFTRVNGVRQTGLTRFMGQPEPADPGMTPPSVPAPPAAGDPTPGGSTDPVKGSAPARVSTPNAVGLGPSKLAVKWSAPKGAKAAAVTGYVVKVYKGSARVRTLEVGPSKRLATVGGLAKSTTYRVGVAAKNANGVGKGSHLDPATTKAKGKNASATKKPAKVKRPTITKAKGKLRVHWSKASTAGALGVSKYQIRLVLHGKTVRVVSVDDRLRAKLVTGLKRHATYSVSVRAANWAGWGSWSIVRSARTK
jgi:hypothetical protein